MLVCFSGHIYIYISVCIYTFVYAEIYDYVNYVGQQALKGYMAWLSERCACLLGSVGYEKVAP